MQLNTDQSSTEVPISKSQTHENFGKFSVKDGIQVRMCPKSSQHLQGQVLHYRAGSKNIGTPTA